MKGSKLLGSFRYNIWSGQGRHPIRRSHSTGGVSSRNNGNDDYFDLLAPIGLPSTSTIPSSTADFNSPKKKS